MICVVDLPAHYRIGDVLAFHGRDSSGLAEQVGADRLRKGLIWNGAPACLSLSFVGAQAHAELHVDDAFGGGCGAAFNVLVTRMLGLTQRVEIFENSFRHHPQIGRLIARHPGLRLPVAASPFEALTWAIAGQQISVSAALSLRRRLIQTAAIRHSSGLYCHPDAAVIARLSHEQVRGAGFSQSKAKALHEVSRRALSGQIELDADGTAPAMARIGQQLLDTPGIGPWTVSYALLRGFGWLDGSLHGDVAVRRGLQSLLDAPDKLGEKEVERWLAPFSPWRALVAAHLWAWTSTKAY